MLNGGHAQRSWAGWQSGGDSDTRNTYDMISAKQEADLRPKLERLDRLIAGSRGARSRRPDLRLPPTWQLDAAAAATVALQKAQATQVYTGLNLWPAGVTARLVKAQLAADGTYPNAAAPFAVTGRDGTVSVLSAAWRNREIFAPFGIISSRDGGARDILWLRVF